jgi:hypothetical protein
VQSLAGFSTPVYLPLEVAVDPNAGDDSMAEPAYRIDADDQEIVVRLRRGVLDRDEVSRFLDYLELEAIRRHSRLSEADAAALADEVDGRVWEAIRPKIEPGQ